MSYQQITVVGNPSADPTLEHGKNGGKAFSRFSVAVNKVWYSGDGTKNEDTVWFKAICFEKTAETASTYIKKGKEVMLIGEVKASAWTDKDGNPQASLELMVQRIILLQGGGPAGDNGSSGSGRRVSQRQEVPEEDLPF